MGRDDTGHNRGTGLACGEGEAMEITRIPISAPGRDLGVNISVWGNDISKPAVGHDGTVCLPYHCGCRRM